MQNKPSNDQHKNIYYRLRRSDPHERKTLIFSFWS